MKLKFFAIIAVVAAGHASAGPNQSQNRQAGYEPQLSEIITSVSLSNPTLNAARAKWEMMKKRVPQARAWEDLMVGLEAQRMGTTRFDTYTDNEWMALQSIPISGKNLSRGRIATSEAMQTFEEYRRTEIDVITRAKMAYFRLSGAYGQLQINAENQALLKQMVEISRSKYEAGMQSQADVLLAQTDLARLAEARAQVEREISDMQTQLNVLMNKPAGTSIAPPPSLVFKVKDIYSAKLDQIALGSRPEVILALRKIEAEKARVQLAKRQWIPDPQIQVKARQFNGTGGIQEYDTGIAFTVPWINYSKYSAGVKEAEKSLENARYEYDAACAEVLGMVRDQVKKIDTISGNYRLYHNQIVPLAGQAVQSTRSSYEADKTSFLELITARRTMHDVDSAALTYLTDYQVAIAELEAIVGSPLASPKFTSNSPSK